MGRSQLLGVIVQYTDTDIAGVTVIDIEPINDERGFSALVDCSGECAKNGLQSAVTQTSLVYTHSRGTLRGLHWQARPYPQAQVVRCTRGAILAAAADVRPRSETVGAHVPVELTAENRRALFVPPYVALGFQTLADDTEVIYQVYGPSEPAAKQGLRWDDPCFGIRWPLPITVISESDANWELIAEGRLSAGSETRLGH
jgi:dTDP-4-dehydrorhamnose 3,5-epimerase